MGYRLWFIGKDTPEIMQVKRHSESDGTAHNVGIEGVGDCPTKFLSEAVGIKFLNVHHRGEVFAREPTLAFAAIGAANVTGVASRSIAAGAVVDEQTVGVEGLR